MSQLGVPFELTHNLERLETVLIAAGETLPITPLPLGELTDYAVVYRYDPLTQQSGTDMVDLITTVRVLREHIVACIAALSRSQGSVKGAGARAGSYCSDWVVVAE